MDVKLGLLLMLNVFLLLISLAALYEKKNWNNGICRKSGLPWRQFDTDSQGGRMYTDDQGNYCDISYPVDTIKKK